MITVSGSTVGSWGSTICVTVTVPAGAGLSVKAELNGQPMSVTISPPTDTPGLETFTVCIRIPKGSGVGLGRVEYSSGSEADGSVLLAR